MSEASHAGERQTADGIAFRVVGEGKPLLLVHGLMMSGGMFEPLVDLLRDGYCMLVPHLRGHGLSGGLPGPYEVPELAADMPAVIGAAGFESAAVLGYSHGGAVAQQLARTHPGVVSRLLLTCTYACNVATVRERIEASVLMALLTVFSPGAIGRLVFRPSAAMGLTRDQVERLREMRGLMAANQSRQMRQAARGLVTFDSRPWLNQIRTPTLVIGGADDTAVPRHHFDALVDGVPGARGRLVEGAGHTLLWTHTRELAEIVRAYV